MDRDSLHERIRRLIFVSPALSASFLRGEFRSVFRGRGLDFDSLREYSPDDDSRLIDWNVSARWNKAFVRSYREDRSLTLFLLLDRSASMDEGMGELSKADMALLAGALLGYAAAGKDMPVGALLFGGAIERHFEPRRGKGHVSALAEAAFEIEGGGGGTALAPAIEAASRLLRRRSLVILLSDFRSSAWELPLAILARKHDVVAVRVSDALERELPGFGSFPLRDPESGQEVFFALGSRRQRRAWSEHWRRDADRIREAVSSSQAHYLELDTADDPALRLLEFFDRRRLS